MSRSVQLTIGALGTLAVYSFLFKENVFYRYMEHLFIGLSAAHGAVLLFHNQLKPLFTNQIAQEGRYSLILPLLLGLLIYFRYAPRRWVWISRLPMAFWVGYNAGYTLAYNPAVMLGQIKATFLKFSAATFGGALNNIIFVTVCVATLFYFMFTVKRTNAVGKSVATFARYCFMVALGVGFANGIQGRVSLVIGRVQYLLGDWLGLLK